MALVRDPVVLQVVPVVQELDVLTKQLLQNWCSLPPMPNDLRYQPVAVQGPMHHADMVFHQSENTLRHTPTARLSDT